MLADIGIRVYTCTCGKQEAISWALASCAKGEMSQRVGYEFKIRPQGMHFSPRLQVDKLVTFTERTPLVHLDDLVTLAKSETTT